MRQNELMKTEVYLHLAATERAKLMKRKRRNKDIHINS